MTFIESVAFLTGISRVSIPRNEKVSVDGNVDVLTEKFPSVSDIVPFFVPLIMTLTPARGTPYSSSMVPEIWADWARV